MVVGSASLGIFCIWLSIAVDIFVPIRPIIGAILSCESWFGFSVCQSYIGCSGGRILTARLFMVSVSGEGEIMRFIAASCSIKSGCFLRNNFIII